MKHLGKGLDVNLTTEDRRRSLGFDVVDLPVALHAYSALGHWLGGSATAARASLETSLALAYETDHPFSISFALAFASWVYQFVGDEAALKQSSADLIALSETNTFDFWLGWGRTMNGWARRKELGEKALTVIEQGLREWHGTASGVGSSYFTYLHADAALYAGEMKKAARLVQEAQAFERSSGEAFWRPELIRLSGELAKLHGEPPKAAALWQEAYDVAKNSGLRFLQLRAAVSIALDARDQTSQAHATELLVEALSGVEMDSQAAIDAQGLLHRLREKVS
jgi:predicted ATPase